MGHKMAQLYNNDTGLMVDQGKTAAEYGDWPDIAEQTIVDVVQTFPADWKAYAWFFVPTANKFYHTTIDRHALWRAAKEIIGPTRWEEIEDALDEQGPINEYFKTLDFPKIKRKVLRAQEKGLITAGEVSQLQSLLP
jgi:hypothetical protein